MNRIKFHVKKGDQVEVISGNFRGSAGKILEVMPSKEQVLIEGKLLQAYGQKIGEPGQLASPPSTGTVLLPPTAP